MGQRVNIGSGLKPLGGGKVKASLKKAQKSIIFLTLLTSLTLSLKVFDIAKRCYKGDVCDVQIIFFYKK